MKAVLPKGSAHSVSLVKPSGALEKSPHEFAGAIHPLGVTFKDGRALRPPVGHFLLLVGLAEPRTVPAFSLGNRARFQDFHLHAGATVRVNGPA